MHNEACFLFAVNGRSLLYHPGGSKELSSGEGFLMKCGNYLNHWEKGEGTDPYEAVAIHFYPDVLLHVYDGQLPDFLKSEYVNKGKPIHRVDIDKMIRQYVESLIFYFENPGIINEELIKLKVKELMLLLLNTDSDGSVKQFLATLFEDETYHLKDVVNQHLFADLNLQELAILCNMSLSTFKRRFNEVFNMSPARYMKQKRLEKAKSMLLTNARVSDIAFDLGFNDPASFTRSFTAEFGISPVSYRKSLA